MATVLHCSRQARAAKTRLESSLPAYTIQWAYSGKCRYCKKEFIYWQGEYATGSFSNLQEVSKVTDLAAWKRRIEQGDFKPEPQITSEYSQRVARGVDMIKNYQYQLRLTKAKQWYKGQRLDEDYNH